MNPSVKQKDVPNDWNVEVADLINNLICRKEENRLGKNGAKAVKEHPWFSNINWDDITNKRVTPIFKPRNVNLYKLF